jgi:hypothetical protein
VIKSYSLHRAIFFDFTRFYIKKRCKTHDKDEKGFTPIGIPFPVNPYFQLSIIRARGFRTPSWQTDYFRL